ncbi:MAG: hypothetical protein V1807_02925 [Patescibacteria group bacterium]
MKHQKVNLTALKRWVSIGKLMLFISIGLFFILGLINHVSWAAGGAISSLEDYIGTSIYAWVGSLVAVIAVVMIIAAGVVYAFDLGGGKQIGLAKDMIISTISGLILFMIASWLLGQISVLFPPVGNVDVTTPGGGAGGVPEFSGDAPTGGGVPMGTPPEGLAPVVPPDSPGVPGMPEQPEIPGGGGPPGGQKPKE